MSNGFNLTVKDLQTTPAITFNEYQDKAFSFANPEFSKITREALLNAALGLCGESVELFKISRTVKSIINHHDKIKKELGDLLWYTALACTALNVDMEDLAISTAPIPLRGIESCGTNLMILSGEFADAIKKIAFQGHTVSNSQIAQISLIFAEIAFACLTYDCPITDVMLANIDKLSKRYPNGFSAERSINRDESKETIA